MTYTATLFDCPASSEDKFVATELFCNAVETHLGGVGNVAEAYRRYAAALEKYGELPLPATAESCDRMDVDRWLSAERAGEQAAFAEWVGNLRGAHFEIRLT